MVWQMIKLPSPGVEQLSTAACGSSDEFIISMQFLISAKGGGS